MEEELLDEEPLDDEHPGEEYSMQEEEPDALSEGEDAYDEDDQGHHVSEPVSPSSPTADAEGPIKSAMETELALVEQLVEREQERYKTLQQAAEVAEEERAKEEAQLRRQLDAVTDKLAEEGLDVSLDLLLAGEVTEEETFAIGAKLREKETYLADLRSKISALSLEVSRKELDYSRLFNDPKRKEIEERLLQTQQKTREEQNKSSTLQEKLQVVRESLRGFKSEASAAKETLLERLVKDPGKHDHYRHVCVSELLRLLLQQRPAKGNVHSQSTQARVGPTTASSSAGQQSNEYLQRMERQVQHYQSKSQKLQELLQSLQTELEGASKAQVQVRSLKNRAVNMLNKQMREKGLHMLANKTTDDIGKKVMVLSEHVERLMLHLKHEAVDKAKAQECEGQAIREMELLRARNETIVSKNRRKDRVILELQEGQRILEDQLRLLDDKYAELRARLNGTRNNYRREIRMYTDQASKLRLRWEQETQGVLPIEMVPLPPGSALGDRSRSAPVSGGVHNAEHMPIQRSWTASGGPDYRYQLQPSSQPLGFDPSLLDGGYEQAEPQEPWSAQRLMAFRRG